MRINGSLVGCVDWVIMVVENGKTKEVHCQVVLLGQMMGWR